MKKLQKSHWNMCTARQHAATSFVAEPELTSDDGEAALSRRRIAAAMQGMEHWKLEASGMAGGRYYPVRKYCSTRTGLTVAIGIVPGPVVNGYIVLRTEAHDDDGCPHTLEHLIFLGSEDYPYKGILDTLANRCLARGTNAWTDVDHTCYTISNAGAEGFLQLLPVYLDHILYPTISESGFDTEVHHITGQGDDAGVVYCEMQGRENTGSSLSIRRLLSEIYPGVCGYKSETGGIMKNLRSLNVSTVRSYHRSYYRPDNMEIIVTGQVDEQQVFSALRSVEEKILKKGAMAPMVRPWTLPVPPFEKVVDTEVEFPAEDDITGGMVFLAWRATTANNYLEKTALKIMWRYLTDSAVDPLRKAFVDLEEPMASKVSPSSFDNSVGVQVCKFSNVPTGQLAAVRPRFDHVIRSQVDGALDMNRMKTVLHNSKVLTLSSLEEQPHESLVYVFIGDFLYGSSAVDFQQALGFLEQCEQLEKEPASYWQSLMRRYLLDQPAVVVRARPSTKAAARMVKDEKLRVQAQVAQLGSQKLAQLAKQLDAAIATNDVPVPVNIIESFRVPDVSKIPSIPVTSIRFDNSQPLVNSSDALYTKLRQQLDSASALPADCWLQFDHINSAFIEINVFLDSSSVSEALRPLIELYLEVLYELPIVRNSRTVPHEQVVAELEADTISYSHEIGFDGSRFNCGTFSQLISLGMKVEQAKYAKGVQWMHEFLFCSQFTPERLKIGCKKILKDVSRTKRSGPDMVLAVIRNTNFASGNHKATIALHQQAFLTKFLQKLENEPSVALEDINTFRRALCQPNCIRVQVVADVSTLANAKQPWTEHRFIPAIIGTTGRVGASQYPTAMPVLPQMLLSKEVNSGKGELVGIAAIESGYLVQSAPGISRFNDPDLPALVLLIEYLATMEGPFWKQIRGQGLSYGYAIRPVVDEALLYFSLSRSVNVGRAYHAARKIVEEFISHKSDFEPAYVASAKSSVVYSIISKEETMSDAAFESFVAYLKGVTNKQMVTQVQALLKADLERVLTKYMSPLFDVAHTNVAVMANPDKLPEIQQDFESLRKLSVHPTIDGFFGVQPIAGGGGDDDDDDDDEYDEDEDEGDDEEYAAEDTEA